MSEEPTQRPIIIIKRIIKKPAHHGGAWKIAYADFVTAMMAFFLLMWLLSMLNKYQLMGISNYFNKPLKNVFVDNKQNDSKQKKIPDEQTKKYKLVLTDKKIAEINAKSLGKKGGEDNTDQENKQTEQKTAAEMEQLKKQFETDLENKPELKKYKEQLTFEVMKDGLKINLRDLENKTMFSSGKSDFEKYAKPLMEWLSSEINKSKRKITIIGHTDSYAYPTDNNYSNWELSVDRANATRRVLIKYGMDKNEIIRIQGAADSIPLDKKFGGNSINRRIEIIILTNEAVQRLLN